MIRTTRESETGVLVDIARRTEVFKPIEIEALEEVLNDYHAGNHHYGHKAVTLEREARQLGFAYYAPTAMTDRTWHLYWIFVDKEIQAKGLGSELLKYVEQDIAALGGRLFLIETSSLPAYEPTRRFYIKHGYDQAALVRDFYADGDDQVIFRKHILRAG